MLPDGEELIVLSHKKIMRLYNSTTITLFVSEEENVILMSLLQDLATYPSTTVAYVTKYLEPGNSDTIAFYPIQSDMEDYVRFNPNITDVTRCINETFRSHIDQVLLLYSDSNNSSVASSFISGIRTQLSGQLAAQSAWVAEHTDEDGNVVGESGTTSSTTDTSTYDTDTSLDAATGEAVDSLEESVEDLEAIQ
jgi:hypothetical protein